MYKSGTRRSISFLVDYTVWPMDPSAAQAIFAFFINGTCSDVRTPVDPCFLQVIHHWRGCARPRLCCVPKMVPPSPELQTFILFHMEIVAPSGFSLSCDFNSFTRNIDRHLTIQICSFHLCISFHFRNSKKWNYLFVFS